MEKTELKIVDSSKELFELVNKDINYLHVKFKENFEHVNEEGKVIFSIFYFKDSMNITIHLLNEIGFEFKKNFCYVVAVDKKIDKLIYVACNTTERDLGV